MSVPETYVDTTLIECNRKTSPQYLAGNDSNPNCWTNDCGNGVKLNVGDQISVHSSYISEIGNESATIEIKGSVARNNLNEGQTYNSSDCRNVKSTNVGDIEGQTLWEYTPTTITNEIRDDEINLTHSYYKNANGEFYIMLPRTCAWNNAYTWRQSQYIWNEYNGSTNGQVNANNPYALRSDYAAYNGVKYYGQTSASGAKRGEVNGPVALRAGRDEIANDGSRYTIFVNKRIYNYQNGGDLFGHRDPALFDYVWYKRTHTYKINTGFNSPSNVAQSFTNQMTDVRQLRTEQVASSALGGEPDRNFDLVADSRVNEPFPCGFGEGFSNHGADSYFTWECSEANEDGGRGVLYEKTLRYASSHGGDYRNSMDTTNITGLKNGMYVVHVDKPANEYLLGARIIQINTANNPPASTGPGTPDSLTCVYLSRVVAGYTNGDKITFSWTGNDQSPYIGVPTYDYYYQSCYASIGYKRPEVQEKGRFMNTMLDRSADGSWVVETQHVYPISNISNHDPNCLITSLEWNDTNLNNLKTFFETQKLYPEVFIYDNMSASQQGLVASPNGVNITLDKSRFIYMNTTPSVYLEATTTDVSVEFERVVVVDDITGLTNGMMLVNQDFFATPSKPDTTPPWFPNDGSALNASRTFITKIDPATKEITLSQPLKAEIGIGIVLGFCDNKVGYDNYLATDNGDTAGALFIDFNKDRELITEGYGDGSTPYETLWGGFARRVEYWGNYYIGFWYGGPKNEPTLGVNGIAENFFTAGGGSPIIEAPTSVEDIGMWGGRALGYDLHFNAYGTCAMMMWNGLAGKFGNEYTDWADQPTQFLTWEDRGDMDGDPKDSGNNVLIYSAADFNTNHLINEIYLGANDAQLNFNGSQSRFEFSQLHTSEMVGSMWNASELPLDATTPCYKINKRLSRKNFSPNFMPYANTSSALLTDVLLLDKNITPFTIMDAHSGIFFEDYGCDEKNWRKSLWELLGFSYDQFHQTTNNRLVRAFNLGLTTSTPTTNAQIQTADLRNWMKTPNASGVLDPTYEPERVNVASWDYKSYPNDPTRFPALYGHQSFVEVVQSASSVTITAEKLPRKMISPIYLVKSDILSSAYIGGQKGTSAMPVVSVVPKDNGYGDFYTGGQGTIFTNTQERTIQNISIDICDADGTPSRVDDSCCVVFKIQKEIVSNNNVISDILKK